jgi:hypothetical protein
MKKPYWVRGYEYYDWYHNDGKHIVLDYKPWSDDYFIAPKVYKPLILYFKARDLMWRVIRWVIRYANKKNWIQADPGEMICWSTVWKWYKSARKW